MDLASAEEDAEDKLFFNSKDMTPQYISIISVFVNLGLAVAKLFFGFLVNSVALTADGIHSTMDIFSSFITFLGLKIAKKPVDEKHPYGHWKAESLAGFLVAIILAISGIWILYEAVMRFLGKEQAVELNIWAIIVVIISILVTEILARLKFYYGGKFKALSLIADAEHSRADALSSLGVLAGLLLANYFNLADVIIALLIGVYILFEAFQISKEITDSLLDVSDKQVEDRIRKICLSHKIEIDSLRTRRIGSFDLAEIRIKVPLKLKVEQAQEILQTLESRLLGNIPELKEVIISIKAYDMSKITVLPKLGKKIGQLRGFERIGPKKLGERIIIPIKDEKIASQFGSDKYLIIDKKDNKILTKKIIDNPYFKENLPRGSRFAKTTRADKVIVSQIGQNAKQGLENFGIKVQVIPDKNIDDILEEIRAEDNSH